MGMLPWSEPCSGADGAHLNLMPDGGAPLAHPSYVTEMQPCAVLEASLGAGHGTFLFRRNRGKVGLEGTQEAGCPSHCSRPRVTVSYS